MFLRWGIFGIIGFAALMYAYNASKRMAEKHSTREPPAAVATDQRETSATQAPEPELLAAPAPTTAPHCEAELVVAQLALEARRQGEPIDRLLRIQEIAFQEPPRRQRLEQVATRWYQLEGVEPDAGGVAHRGHHRLRRFSPAP